MENSEDDSRNFKTNPKNQFVAGGIVLVTVSIPIGLMFGFSAILLPQLEDENIMYAKSEEASWIASVVNISQIIGSIASGSLAGVFGRKKVILMSSILMVVSWALIGFSDGNVGLLTAGRLLQGGVFLGSVSQCYLAEISDSKRRGILAGSGPLFVSTGITIVYILGAFLPWRWVCLVCAGFPAASILLWTCIPETPSWLAHNGKREEAEKALRWLRGPDHDVADEMRTLGFLESSTETNEASKKDKKSGLKNLLTQMSKPSALRPFLLLMAMFSLQQGCGTFAVVFYAVNVFQDAGVATNPYYAAILTGLIRQAGSLLGVFFIARFSRKILMIFSAFSMALSMFALGATLHVKASFQQEIEIVSFTNETFLEEIVLEKSSIETILSILPIVEIVLYMLTFGVGVGTVPWLLLGELCPIEVKGFASGIVACMASATIFVVVKIFPDLVINIGAHGAYYLFGVVCIIMTAFSFFCVPETRGKSDAELQQLFQKHDKIKTISERF